MSRFVPSLGLALAGVAVAGLALTGCGDSKSRSSTASGSTASASAAAAGSSTGSADKPDPCKLLTDSEVSQWLGSAATHSAPKAEFRGVNCTWKSAGTAFLTLAVYSGKEFYSPKQQAPDSTALSGVGDEAFTSQALAGARKGDLVVIVGGYGASDHFPDALRAALSRA